MQPPPQPISTHDAIAIITNVIVALGTLGGLGATLWMIPRRLDTKIAILRLFISLIGTLAFLFCAYFFLATDSIGIPAGLALIALLVQISLFLTSPTGSPGRLEIVSMMVTVGFIFSLPPIFAINKLLSLQEGTTDVITRIISHLEKKKSANPPAPDDPRRQH
jgi:hypothetical protein